MSSSAFPGKKLSVPVSSSQESSLPLSNGTPLDPKAKLEALLKVYCSELALGDPSDSLNRESVQTLIRSLVTNAPSWSLTGQDVEALNALPSNIMVALQEVYNSAANGPK